MRLVIIDDEGTTHEVMADIESYDLRRAPALTGVMNAIEVALTRLRSAKKQAASTPEHVRIDGGSIQCLCGNNLNEDGFYTSDRLGHEVEPAPGNWPGGLYTCERCRRIIRLPHPTAESAEVVGRLQLRATVRSGPDGWHVELVEGERCLKVQGFGDRAEAQAYADKENAA